MPKSARCQIAGDAAHAQRIGPVRGDGYFDHRINLGRIVGGKPVGKPRADLTRRQFDNAVMLIRELHFTLRAHHAKAFDAANFSHSDGGINAGHIGAGLGNHHRDARAGIRGAADDLTWAFIGVDLTDL